MRRFEPLPTRTALLFQDLEERMRGSRRSGQPSS
jgi:hypothetical protein